MSVDAATVRRIAHLARIAVDDSEVEHLRGEINAILAFVEQLSEVNVEGVEPMTSVIPMKMKMRADVVTEGDQTEAILQNAPAWQDRFFAVPKVVECHASRVIRPSSGERSETRGSRVVVRGWPGQARP